MRRNIIKTISVEHRTIYSLVAWLCMRLSVPNIKFVSSSLPRSSAHCEGIALHQTQQDLDGRGGQHKKPSRLIGCRNHPTLLFPKNGSELELNASTSNLQSFSSLKSEQPMWNYPTPFMIMVHSPETCENCSKPSLSLFRSVSTRPHHIFSLISNMFESSLWAHWAHGNSGKGWMP